MQIRDAQTVAALTIARKKIRECFDLMGEAGAAYVMAGQEPFFTATTVFKEELDRLLLSHDMNF